MFNTEVTSLADSFRNQSWSARILRIWLGATFLYAGWNKASDGAFFTPGSSRYIGSQLLGFSHGSPIGPLLRLASHQAAFVGWVTLLSEMAIGIAILLNVASLPAAIFGALLSLTLWLSSSWQVRPYFLASDPAYLVMWSAYALSLVPRKGTLNTAKRSQRGVDRGSSANLDRREVVRIGAVGGLALLGGLLGRLFKSSSVKKTQPANTSSNSSNAASGSGNGSNVLLALSSLPVWAAYNFTAANGDPAVLIRTGNSRVSAFDAICTHAGCTVGYDPGSKTLICPCHGAQYDPLSHGAVLAGPAPAPLAEIKVKIDGSNIVLT